MSNADLAVMFGGVFVFVVVILYITHKFITVSNKVKEVCSSELPYKVDPPHTITTVDVAIPSNPKRPYTKRSKYWTDKRKKAAAAKARKTKRKSK